MFVLTLPLVAWLMLDWRVPPARRPIAGTLAAVIAGVLVWAIPLTIASGGPSAYLNVLSHQGGEDFSGVRMLWTSHTVRDIAYALRDTFVLPWATVPLATTVLVLAGAGALVVAWRSRMALWVIALSVVPYAAFHLLFQEAVTVRYALPLVLPIAYLVVSALEWPGRGVLPAGAAALAAWSLFVTLPATVSYGRTGSPAFRALGEAAGGAVDPGQPERVVAFHAVARRAAEWMGAALPARVLTGPHGHEWLALVNHWKSSPGSVVSFVADPRRTDLLLFDPTARSAPRPYRWGFVEPPFVGGARPGDSDVYTMRPPGWMLDRGWALTAELGGVSARDGAGPHLKPTVAWIRSRPEDALLMIGGRHLGGSGDPDIHLNLTLDGRPLHSLDAKPGYFFTLVPVAAGTLAGSGPYVPLEVKSETAGGNGGAIPAGLEQFDLQSPGVPMVGAAEGWYEPEYNPRTARSWRWVSERGTLWVRPVGRDVTLTLTGESPLRYYDAAPSVTISIAGRQIARYQPQADFTQDVVLPADALASAEGRVVVESDKFFVPGDRDAAADRRHLALRIYSFAVR